MKRLALLALLFSFIPSAFAQMDPLQNKEYSHCIQLTRIDPERAFEKALGWQDLGGGLAAQHCAAVALVSLGQYKQAAERLEALAKEMPDDTPPGIVADILGQAGMSLYHADDLDRAYILQTQALKLSPKHPILLTDRAFTLQAAGRYQEALDDLNSGIEVNPDDVDMRVYRASALRFLKRFDDALLDLDFALKYKPDHAEGLLERGNVHRLMNKNDLARKDWLAVIEFHEGRPAADRAQRNLQKLDIKSE